MVKDIFSFARLSKGRVRSCCNEFSGFRCFVSISWCLSLRRIPLTILCNRVHLVSAEVNEHKGCYVSSYKVLP